MERFDVPCPQCGSIQVTVRGRLESPSPSPSNRGDAPPRVPLLHRCACENCRHTFQHDFAFSR